MGKNQSRSFVYIAQFFLPKITLEEVITLYPTIHRSFRKVATGDQNAYPIPTVTKIMVKARNLT